MKLSSQSHVALSSEIDRSDFYESELLMRAHESCGVMYTFEPECNEKCLNFDR